MPNHRPHTPRPSAAASPPYGDRVTHSIRARKLSRPPKTRRDGVADKRREHGRRRFRTERLRATPGRGTIAVRIRYHDGLFHAAGGMLRLREASSAEVDE